MSNSIRILVIDDSVNIRKNIKTILNKLGYSKIDECADGKEALQFLQNERQKGQAIDLVFSDIEMPEMDGLQLLTAVRADAGLQNTPFIMVTTESKKTIVIKAVMTGISGYIVKPFTPEDIRTKIDEVFASARSLQRSAL